MRVAVSALFALLCLCSPVLCAGEVFDDSAFYWFGLTLLALVLVLPTYRRIKLALAKEVDSGATAKAVQRKKAVLPYEAVQKRVDSPDFAHLRGKVRVWQESERHARLFSVKSFIFYGLWVLMFFALSKMPEYMGKEVLSFDPFEVLGVEKGADLPAIRKAYKLMSLKFHPDKNPNDVNASNRFVLIAKAHETLTDETARKNWEKYGNPDGYQGTAMVVGLPTWLTAKGNETRVLLGYLFLAILAPPLLLVWWWKKTSKTDESGVMQETRANYYVHLIDTAAIPVLIEHISLAAEFKAVVQMIDPVKRVFWEYVQQIRDDYQTLAKTRFQLQPETLHIYTANVCLHAHLNRLNAPAVLRPAIERSVEVAFQVLDTMVDFSLISDVEYGGRRTQHSNTAIAAVRLSQYITQAVWPLETPLMQLPHITADEIHCCTVRNKKRVYTIKDYLSLSEDEKLKIFRSQTTETLAEIDRVAKLIPDIEVTLNLENECAEDEDYENQENAAAAAAAAAVVPTEEGAASTSTGAGAKSPKSKANAENDTNAAGTSAGAAAGAAAVVETKGKGGKMLEKNRKGQTLKIYEFDKLVLKVEIAQAGAPPFDQAVDSEEEAKNKVRRGRFFTEKGEVAREPVLVHAPHIAFVKQERWFIFICNKEGAIVAMEKIVSPRYPREVFSVPFVAPAKGTHEYTVHVVSDSYIGCDREQTFRFTVAKTSAEYAAEAEERMLADRLRRKEERKTRLRKLKEAEKSKKKTDGKDGSKDDSDSESDKDKSDNEDRSDDDDDADFSDEEEDELYTDHPEEEEQSSGTSVLEMLGYTGAFLFVAVTAISYLQSQGYLAGVTERVSTMFGFSKANTTSSEGSADGEL